MLNIKTQKTGKRVLLFMFSFVFIFSADAQSKIIDGITVVAPPSPIDITEFEQVKNLEAGWVSLVPFGFSKGVKDTVSFNHDWQWWGERKEGIVDCIDKAHKAGLKVMLKPQVYIHGEWVGDVDFESEAEWTAWEQSYKRFIFFFAEIAKAYEVEMYCIGTEYKLAAQNRPAFWREIIHELRRTYKGKLVYSSNWDGYDKVPFWDDLDYIGISAYFPLSKQKTPTINLLKRRWRPIKKELKSFSYQLDKPILFTEYGYLSVDHCAFETWNLEKKIGKLAVNEKAQANALSALYATLWDADWWAGGFLWKWFPAELGHEGYFEKDYTPQGKIALNVIKKWYEKSN